MPKYWLADINSRIHLFIDRALKIDNPSDYIFIDGKPGQSDFFMGVERRGVFITQKVKDWMDDHFPGHFTYYLISRK